jgi:hypothetical protein
MESLGATLDRKSFVAEPPAFDTIRQISTLFAVSDAAIRPPAIEEGTPVLPRPAATADSSTGSQSLRPMMASPARLTNIPPGDEGKTHQPSD